MLGGLVRLVKSAVGQTPSPVKSTGPNGLLTPDEVARRFPEVQSDPDVDQEAAQAWVSANFNKIKISMATYHQNIWRAILFYVGQTWLTWDQGRRWWIPSVPEDDFTPQPRINYFSPAMDAVASNFNTIPQVEAIARDTESDEEQYRRHGIATVANLLAKDFVMRTALKSDFQSRDDKPSKAALTFILQGTLLTYVQAREKKPMQGGDLGTITERSVECDLLPALEALPRPGSYDLGGMSGSPYLHICRRMTLGEVYNRFKLNADPDNESISGASNVYQASLNYFYVGSDLVDMQAEDSCLVVETLVPPMSDANSGLREFAETGLYSVYINQKVRYCEPWKFVEHPITKIDYIRVPQLFFGRTPAFDCVPLQEEIQAYESLIKLHGMSNAVSPWVIDANTLVGEITGRADKVIKYRSLGPNSPAPHRAQHGTLDSGIYDQVKRLQAQFDNISGAASVFRGRQEGSVTSGTAIAQLRGQAELMFARPVINWNNGWKETVRKAVVFTQKCYTLAQITTICGSDMGDAIRDFIAAPDLNNVLEWLTSNHGLPRTQDELRQEMMELFDKGALDLKDTSVRERLYQLFGETGMMKMFNLDATRARMENKQMRAGTPPTFRPAIEDLDVHYAIHTEFVKSLAFDKLAPPIQELFLAHVMETKAALAPPPVTGPPSNLSFSAKLEDMPPAMVDAVLEAHQIAPPPDVPAPPHHSTGKPGQPLPPPAAPGIVPTRPSGPATLAARGKATGGTLTPKGQGVQPIGAAKGAPPAPNRATSIPANTTPQ